MIGDVSVHVWVVECGKRNVDRGRGKEGESGESQAKVGGGGGGEGGGKKRLKRRVFERVLVIHQL